MYVWCPHLDKDIEQLVKGCHQCQVYQSDPPKAPLQPWSWLTRPWNRLHIDYAGPMYGGKMCLVVIDAHSKWLKAAFVSSAINFSSYH